MKTITIQNDHQSIVNVTIGEKVIFYNFVNVYGCIIGDETKIGSFVEIQKNVVIGKRCKISSHTFICEGVHIGDEVFIGHNVTFINDKYPQSVNSQGELQTEKDWNVIETHIGNGVSIGSGSTILCGLKIGGGAVIGAGSVVTKDVSPGVIVAGNPAHYLRQRETGREGGTQSV
jgi:acetyltransferase-like isoleucine patch superfamily enzyme